MAVTATGKQGRCVYRGGGAYFQEEGSIKWVVRTAVSCSKCAFSVCIYGASRAMLPLRPWVDRMQKDPAASENLSFLSAENTESSPLLLPSPPNNHLLSVPAAPVAGEDSAAVAPPLRHPAAQATTARAQTGTGNVDCVDLINATNVKDTEPQGEYDRNNNNNNNNNNNITSDNNSTNNHPKSEDNDLISDISTGSSSGDIIIVIVNNHNNCCCCCARQVSGLLSSPSPLLVDRWGLSLSRWGLMGLSLPPRLSATFSVTAFLSGKIYHLWGSQLDQSEAEGSRYLFHWYLTRKRRYQRWLKQQYLENNCFLSDKSPSYTT